MGLHRELARDGATSVASEQSASAEVGVELALVAVAGRAAARSSSDASGSSAICCGEARRARPGRWRDRYRSSSDSAACGRPERAAAGGSAGSARGVRRVRGRVERRVLDRVAHPDHALVAVRLDVDQRAAVLEPELAVQRIVHLVVHVHVLVHEADVELQRLHDRGHVVALDAHEAAHAVRVHRARAHPEVDRDLVQVVERPARDDRLRQRRLVREHAEEHVLVGDREQLVAGKAGEGGDHVRTVAFLREVCDA